MASTVCELKKLLGLLSSFGITHRGPMQLFCDSQFALHITANPVFHERTKNIEVDSHFIRDEIQRGLVHTRYIHMSVQRMDILTKALGKPQFDRIGYCARWAPGIRMLHLKGGIGIGSTMSVDRILVS